MTTLFLVRHAHVDGGSDGTPRLLGWTDVPLSTRGERECASLQAVARRPEPVTVSTSPLRRALRTAEAIAASHAWPLQILPALREIGCGGLDGELVANVQRDDRELWHRNLRQDDADFRWPEGESHRELRARVQVTLPAIARRHEQQAAVVVTHAGVITQGLGMLAGRNPADWSFCRPGCASITMVSWSESTALQEVLSCDDRAHLGGPAGRPFPFATPRQPVG
jgi:broad specificity phosphatase PhoE